MSVQITEEFAVTFTNSVHGGLDKVLGTSGTSAVLFNMQMTRGLPNPAEFHRRLVALFGPAGALSLERAIVKDLAARLKWSLELLNVEGVFDFNAVMSAVEKGAKA
jgi:hypothetical protein